VRSRQPEHIVALAQVCYRAAPAKSVSVIEAGIRIGRKADYANGLNDEELSPRH